jgi:hypothetical protein
VWTFWGREKLVAPTGIRAPDRQAHSPVYPASHYWLSAQKVSCATGLVRVSPPILAVIAFVMSARAHELYGCRSIPG